MKATAANPERPLVVDLDGTLVRVDTLHESFLKSLQQDPWATIRALAGAASDGKAAIKGALAGIAIPDVSVLPYRPEVLELIDAHRQAGGKVVLATGAHVVVARAVSDFRGCFDEVIATQDAGNMIGANKAAALCARFGEGGFDYVGDSAADVPVWKIAARGWVVGSEKRRQKLSKLAGVELSPLVEKTASRKAWTVLRPHQWAKNALVALPILASHQFLDPVLIERTLLTMAAFCTLASLVYVGNDLFDRESDRRNPSKRVRAVASGAISIPFALGLMAVLSLATVALGVFLPGAARLGLGTYFAANLLYTLHFKRRLLLDVFLLASMYVWRIAVGALATGIVLSGWLLSFSVFLFLSLAFAKRYAEVIRLEKPENSAAGRAWRREDAPFLAMAGVGTGIAGAIVLSLYVTGESFSRLYASPQLVTALSPLYLYWNLRLWIQACRQDLHEDPVLFAAKDKVSYLVMLAGVAILVLASIRIH
jgi:4-hydroxybenzoate polyprenyltransferase/phosphoserine phosphatase